MTTQAPETIEYRCVKYSAMGAPLIPYLEANPDIKFEMYTTAHWRGYQGYWLIESNKLYLKGIESANYTMVDLFHSNAPVLADWYSGQISFGIGNCEADKYCDYYETHVWLNIENGKVIEKKIVKSFYHENRLNFGKYKGKNFEDILYGKIHQNTFVTIRDFIICLLDFIIRNDFEFNVQCPTFTFNDSTLEIIRKVRNTKINYFLTQNYLAINSQIYWANVTEDKESSNISSLIEKILTSDFTKNYITLTKQSSAEAEIAEKTTLINPDIQYLNWALESVESFSVSPNYLKRTFLIRRLKYLKIKRLNNTIFEFEPVIETINYKFPESILKINEEKFEKIYDVKVDPENNLLISNLPEKELMKEFGFYLDENYIAKDEVKVNEYKQHYKEYYSDNDWLRDVAGTDDPEVKRDVYWNLD